MTSPQIDPDAQHNVQVLGLVGVGGGHTLLEIDGAVNRVDGTSELYQHAVAGRLEDAALVFGD
jgi:hypothetical protein